MRTKTVSNQSGQPLYVEADAGKKGEKRLRARFSIAKQGSLEQAQRAAEIWLEQAKELKRGDVSELFRLSRRDQEKCLEALELLEPYRESFDLVEVVKRYLATYRKDSLKTPWTYKEAAELWLQDKRDANQSKKYLHEMEVFFTTTARYFGKKLCDEISVEDLKGFIRDRDQLLKEWQKKRGAHDPVGLAPDTRNSMKRNFTLLFNYAIQQRHASHNPGKALPRTKVVRHPATLLSPDQTRDFLSACELRFLPYAAAGFFAGIRPEETLRVMSAYFNIERLTIDLRAAVSKTNQRRIIEMMPSLSIWLKPIVHLFDKPLTESEVRGARERAEEASGIVLPRDPFRKCFASYHYARFQDLKKSMYLVGHTNPKTFFDHYFDAAEQTDAIAYFSILPSSCKFKHQSVRDMYAGIDETLPEAKIIQLG